MYDSEGALDGSFGVEGKPRVQAANAGASPRVGRRGRSE